MSDTDVSIHCIVRHGFGVANNVSQIYNVREGIEGSKIIPYHSDSTIRNDDMPQEILFISIFWRCDDWMIGRR